MMRMPLRMLFLIVGLMAGLFAGLLLPTERRMKLSRQLAGLIGGLVQQMPDG